MCGDVADATRGLDVRATFDGTGWVVVVTTGTPVGRVRATVLQVDLDLQVPLAILWGAIAVAAARFDLSLPLINATPPDSPSAGVREWHLDAAP